MSASKRSWALAFWGFTIPTQEVAHRSRTHKNRARTCRARPPGSFWRTPAGWLEKQKEITPSMNKVIFALSVLGLAWGISQGTPPQCNVFVGGSPVSFGCNTFGIKAGVPNSRLNCTESAPGIMPWTLRPTSGTGTGGAAVTSYYTLTTSASTSSSDPQPLVAQRPTSPAS